MPQTYAIPTLPLDQSQMDAITAVIEPYDDGATIDIGGQGVSLAQAAAAEVYAALDDDGGVPTARFVIWLIRQGRMSAGNYVTKQTDLPGCACFFGGIALAEFAQEYRLVPQQVIDQVTRSGLYTGEGDDDEFIDLDGKGRDKSRFMYNAHDVLRAWRDDGDFTVVERMLINGQVDPGDTEADNIVLHFLLVVLQTYITDHGEALGAEA